jgi:Mce-associated membrane protein
MPSRKPSASLLDSREDDASLNDALALAEQAEAEAQEAEAAAAAARARARAIRRRNQAAVQELPGDDDATEDGDEAETAELTESGATELIETTEEEPRQGRRLQIPRLFWKVLASCLAIIAICALLGASGFMIWRHRQADHHRQLTAEYTAAARQSVVTLMSLDFNHVGDDVKRILDNSTGDFKKDFEAQQNDFVKLAQQSKVVTETTVNAAAVDTMTDDNAVVLIAATTRVTNTAGAQQQPRSWRVAVNLTREADQIKLAKVEFVP